jgi:hypothetical protein
MKKMYNMVFLSRVYNMVIGQSIHLGKTKTGLGSMPVHEKKPNAKKLGPSRLWSLAKSCPTTIQKTSKKPHSKPRTPYGELTKNHDKNSRWSPAIPKR